MLNVSGNNLDSIHELQQLYCLCQFMASDNQLTDMKEVADCLLSWRHLWRLDLMANPLCHRSKYRDRIIILGPSLGRWQFRAALYRSSCSLSSYQLWSDNTLLYTSLLKEMLDGKEVTETARQFLKNWQASKDLMKKRSESGLTRDSTGLHSGRHAEFHLCLNLWLSVIGLCTINEASLPFFQKLG